MHSANTIKIMTVVGARPNFMKAAPILAAIRGQNVHLAETTTAHHGQEGPVAIQSVMVHTGQHYDEAMSDRFFADLSLPKPDVYLGVGSGSHAAQTAEIMKRFEEVLLRERPDVLIVVGDVNSTLACALVASKISFDGNAARPLIAHVEAGLRSFDRDMPEEINRILTDHVSDLLFVTEESGLRNLQQEGIARGKIHFVGNTMIDSLLAFKEKAGSSSVLDRLNLRAPTGDDPSRRTARYALLTLHRPSNVDRPETFLNILEGLEDLRNGCPIIFPAHPRTHHKVAEFGFERFFEFETIPGNANGSQTHRQHGNCIRLIGPLGYLDFLCLMANATMVVTDSGGVQEETTCLGVPCVTVRENTERPITVQVGTNVLSGVSTEGIREATRRQLSTPQSGAIPERWDGKSAQRILDVICREAAMRSSRPASASNAVGSERA